MKISLIIPAYNESEGVEQTATALRETLSTLRANHEIEVVFVNDGSKDATESLLQNEFKGEDGIRVVSHDRNRGLGAAIRTGFANVSGELVVTTDFDGTYKFSSIPLIVDQLLHDKVDIVTASPYHPQGKVLGVPGYRLIFSFGASFLYRLLVNWHIHTWTALFRAYRRPVIEQATFDSNDFLAGTELLVNAMRAGFTVSEFPTTLSVRTFGQSSIKIARVTRAHLQFQFAIIRARLTGNRTGAVHVARKGS
jgi:dolichol-phosphate mannosyltransferase